MTLGELVTTVAGRMAKPGLTAGHLRYVIPLLRFIGLWDAEVHELVWDGGYGDQSEPEEYERAEFRTWDGKHFDSDAVFREGQRVRIIVLPQEE